MASQGQPLCHSLDFPLNAGLGRYSAAMETEGAAAAARGPWVCSAAVDRSFLRAGLYAALAVLALFVPFGGPPQLTHANSGMWGIGTLFVYAVLVVPHFTMTWWIWLGNGPLRAALRRQRFHYANAAFFAVAAPVLLLVTQHRAGAIAVLTTIGVIDAYHFISQDQGFLSVYRHRAGEAPAEARRDNRLMRYTAWWMLLNTLGHPGAAYYVDIGLHDMPDWPFVLPSAVFWASHVVLLLLLGDTLRAQRQAPGGPNRAKLLYLASAIGSYALVPVTPLLGYFAARIHHSASYLGLCMHITRNLDRSGHFQERLLPWAARRPGRFLAVMTVASLPIFACFVVGAQVDGFGVAIALAALVTFHHYFVDTFIWRFRRQEVRDHVGAYI